MVARWVVVCIWSLFCLVSVVQAAMELDLSQYEIYYGEMDSDEYGLDGYPDILLHARSDYIYIPANVGFPLISPSELPDLLFCGTASGQFMACTLKGGSRACVRRHVPRMGFG